MFEVRMPQKGLTETSAYLSKWYVAPGDKVKTGDYLFAMETSKSVFDVESEADGTVIAVLYPEGDEVDVEAVVCVIGKEGETYDGAPAPAAKEEPAPAAPAPVKQEAAAEKSAEAPAAPPAVKESAPAEAAPVRAEGERIAISPRAKAKAEELGFDYSSVVPTGPEGRIIEEDILRAYEEAKKAEAEKPAEAAPVSAFAPMPVAATAALAPEAAAFPAYSVETKIFTFDAGSLYDYEKVLLSFPQEGRAINSRNDMILYAVSKTAAQHPEMMRGLPVFFAGSGAPYYVPALDPAAGWSLGVGAPKRELADAPDGSSKEIRTVSLAFVYSTALFERDAVDSIAEELINALEHFPAFLAMRA
ncbi:MAG: hypothetical protein E7240_02195 [Lachnospiraceae bacterium]|nr:hypothetical protein [Lachnospiraceae bacterium]